jgi:hypothetical protein
MGVLEKEKVMVPKLRFGEFQDDWTSKKLVEVSDFLDGRRKPIKSGDRAKRISLLWRIWYY